jgi:hypothetical protein
MADQKISADQLLAGGDIDPANDFIPIVDMSEPDATKNKKVTPSGLYTSPTFTGTPAAPTAAQGTNTTQLATTAFVMAEIDIVKNLNQIGGMGLM